MEEGFLLDQGHSVFVQTQWHRGQPKPGSFLGLRTGGIEYQKREVLPVTTYRCTGCGLLKSYARG